MVLDVKRKADPRPRKTGSGRARPPGGAKPNAPLDHEELELDEQKAYHIVSARLACLGSDSIQTALRQSTIKKQKST